MDVKKMEVEARKIAGRFDTVVFDFDNTLTVAHTRGAQPVRELAVRDRVLANVRSLEFTRHTLPLLHKNGVRLCVATFADDRLTEIDPSSGCARRLGGRSLVRRYLDAVFGKERPFLVADRDFQCWNPAVLANGSCSNNPTCKNEHLFKLLGEKADSRRVALVDDDQSNCLAAFAGRVACSVRCRDGYGPDVWSALLQMAEDPALNLQVADVGRH
jgi:hypothetical protein